MKVKSDTVMKMTVFWDVTPGRMVEKYQLAEAHVASILKPENGGSRFFRNIVTSLPE
jgi:hypothetical protein